MDRRIERILEISSARGYECEVYGEVSDRFQIEVYRGEVESVDRSRNEGMGIRLSRDGRIGYSYSNDLSEEGIRMALDEAASNTDRSSPTGVDVLADMHEMDPPGHEEIPLECSDHSDIFGPVAMMEKTSLSFDDSIVNTEGAGFSETVGEVMVSSTKGFFRRERRSLCSCSLAAVAQKGEQVRTGWYYSQATSPDGLDFEKVGLEAAKRAWSLLESRPIPTGRHTLLIDGTAFVDIIYLLEQALSGEMLVKGTTVFANRLGERIADPMLTIVDDPFLEGGCFNASFDDEGIPKRKVTLVENGVLKAFLHNTYSSRKAGCYPGGNAVRSSYKDPPAPGPSNMYVLPGKRTCEEMMGDMREGVYVLNIMGMHTADPISGDFSVGINGLQVESGARGKAVNEMTISGNIIDLLSGIREVGKDLEFIGPYGAPAVLVEGLSVSGT